MRFAITFGCLGALFVALAIRSGGAVWLLLWPGLSFSTVAAGYAAVGPRVFGKRPDGALSAGPVLLLLPYLVSAWVVWHLQRLLSRTECCTEVAPGIWLGRRAFARELPAGVSLVVDLTAEFPEPRAVRGGREYLCIPTLDGLPATPEAMVSAARNIARAKEPVYLHCALGRGRSAMLAAAVLMAKGLAGDPDEAETMLRRARPAVKLTTGQRKLLHRVAPALVPVPALASRTSGTAIANSPAVAGS